VKAESSHAASSASAEVHPHTYLGGYIHGSDANTWYPELWTWLKKTFDLKSVLDVGCGEGYTTRYWQSLGCETLGIDGSPIAIRDNVVPQAVRVHDFTSGAFQPPRPFDAVWCCEVVEHIDERYVAHVLDTFAAGRIIVMTHAVPGQTGHHHVNCQPSTYWARLLGQRGYHLQYGPTRQARNLAHSYFCKTGMIFTRERSTLPANVALFLLELEWFPRRVWRHLRHRGMGSVVSTLTRGSAPKR
jgi:SAM-dependent methyltransferase